MQIIPAKTPGFVKTLFPYFVWHIDTKQKDLFLTFDDGPTPEITTWVLEQLSACNAKATFFCIGNNIENYPELFEAILSEGHTVGNHTYNHLKGWKHKTKIYVEDIEKTQSLIRSKIKILNSKSSHLKFTESNFFRPPYGKLKTKQSKKIQELGYKIVMWDVLSYDWDKSISADACFNTVISTATEGSIVVFHDSVKAFENLKHILPRVLNYYKERGFSFKSL